MSRWPAVEGRQLHSAEPPDQGFHLVEETDRMKDSRAVVLPTVPGFGIPIWTSRDVGTWGHVLLASWPEITIIDDNQPIDRIQLRASLEASRLSGFAILALSPPIGSQSFYTGPGPPGGGVYRFEVPTIIAPAKEIRTRIWAVTIETEEEHRIRYRCKTTLVAADLFWLPG